MAITIYNFSFPSIVFVSSFFYIYMYIVQFDCDSDTNQSLIAYQITQVSLNILPVRLSNPFFCHTWSAHITITLRFIGINLSFFLGGIHSTWRGGRTPFFGLWGRFVSDLDWLQLSSSLEYSLQYISKLLTPFFLICWLALFSHTFFSKFFNQFSYSPFHNLKRFNILYYLWSVCGFFFIFHKI